MRIHVFIGHCHERIPLIYFHHLSSNLVVTVAGGGAALEAGRPTNSLATVVRSSGVSFHVGQIVHRHHLAEVHRPVEAGGPALVQVLRFGGGVAAKSRCRGVGCAAAPKRRGTEGAIKGVGQVKKKKKK